ncbi:MAG: vanadium-dependent haloperoxidase [Acidimicrobiia bacterium]|nr:vanadium-dependent haloperoxidase [Acidimicrobiia bacterium]MDH4306039.1 vanadium-dependent haloperoxidase [Acidimicrobiia bacterium]MDH5294279.1 vanadium-dependent haloperoxidase [Acidimicrobiia bacterium]
MAGSQLSRRAFIKGAATATGALLIPGTAWAAPGHPLAKEYSPDVLLGWVGTVYAQVKAERFTPPSAARAYGYLGVTAYEAVVGGMPQYTSLAGSLNGLRRLPARVQSQRYDWPTVVNAALARTMDAVFADRSAGARQALAAHAETNRSALRGALPAPVFDRSDAFGATLGSALVSWIDSDNYLATRGLPYDPPVGPSLWVRTPPNFGAALEPHWEQVRSFTLADNAECAPQPPVPYSEDPGSDFYAQALTVYETSLALTDAQRDTAMFWRDNPDGSTGLPSGHWALTETILIRDLGMSLAAAAEMLAVVGVAVADGFTSCWTEKYRTNLLRPVTYILRHIDPAWASFVNSPAFPEYTSGHSVGSGAAAEAITALVGSISYTDDTGLDRGFAARTFTDVWEAAHEAAVSRLYGGIHYPMAITVGVEQGIQVARKVLERAKTRRG